MYNFYLSVLIKSPQVITPYRRVFVKNRVVVWFDLSRLRIETHISGVEMSRLAEVK